LDWRKTSFARGSGDFKKAAAPRTWNSVWSNLCKKLTDLKWLINLSAPLDEHAASRRCQINRNIAGGDLDEPVTFHHVLTRVGVPGRYDDWHARQVEVRQPILSVHQN
jgi:hypothetical protein